MTDAFGLEMFVCLALDAAFNDLKKSKVITAWIKTWRRKNRSLI